MSPTYDQPLTLVDAQERALGSVEIERIEGGLVFGRFLAALEFAAVSKLFDDFEEASNCQALGLVDKLDAAIEALGLRLRWPGETLSMAVRDVQIWHDGGITFRLDDLAEPAVNGSVHTVAAKSGSSACH